MLPARVRTKPWPGTTPSRRSDSGSARTGRSAALPIANRSNVPGTIWSTQVRACSPDSSRVEPPSVTVHHTAPRRNMTTPSRTGTTMPNARASAGSRPMTQAASRAAIVPAGTWRSEATAAARSRSSRAASSEPASASPRGIRMTVSPNRPTRPGPGSMPMCVVICSIVLPLHGGAPGQEWTPLVANSHSAEVAHNPISDTKTTPPSTGRTHLGILSRWTRLSILATNAP